MRLLRHHRIRTRLSLLAMVALLWSQFALAAHPGCTTVAGTHSVPVAHAATAAMAAMPGCTHEAPPPDQPVCQSHCSQGGLSSDVARVPPVPPLPAMLAVSWMAVVVPPQSAVHSIVTVERPPPVSWHRPTAHPAALLLI